MKKVLKSIKRRPAVFNGPYAGRQSHAGRQFVICGNASAAATKLEHKRGVQHGRNAACPLWKSAEKRVQLVFHDGISWQREFTFEAEHLYDHNVWDHTH